MVSLSLLDVNVRIGLWFTGKGITKIALHTSNLLTKANELGHGQFSADDRTENRPGTLVVNGSSQQLGNVPDGRKGNHIGAVLNKDAAATLEVEHGRERMQVLAFGIGVGKVLHEDAGLEETILQDLHDWD
jgi:hypothetical protein